MKNIKRWLLRQWYKFNSPSQNRIMAVHRMDGKFRVLYPDGRKSQPFGWSTACDYAEMFGGKVIDNF